MCNPVSLFGNPDLLSYQRGECSDQLQSRLFSARSVMLFTQCFWTVRHIQKTRLHPNTHTDSLACRTAFQTALAEARLPLTESITVPWAFLCPAAVGMLRSEFGERRELDRVGYAPAGDKGSRQKGQTPLADLRSATVMHRTHLPFPLYVCLWHGVEWMCGDRYVKCTVLKGRCENGMQSACN